MSYCERLFLTVDLAVRHVASSDGLPGTVHLTGCQPAKGFTTDNGSIHKSHHPQSCSFLAVLPLAFMPLQAGGTLELCRWRRHKVVIITAQK